LPHRRDEPACVSLADHEIIFAELVHQPKRVGRRMLAVAVDDQDVLTGRGADARLDRGTVALLIRVADHGGARAGRLRAGAIRRAVVNHENLVPRGRGLQFGHDAADGLRLVTGGYDDGDGSRIRHGRR
jgi:hypothetical protein